MAKRRAKGCRNYVRTGEFHSQLLGDPILLPIEDLAFVVLPELPEDYSLAIQNEGFVATLTDEMRVDPIAVSARRLEGGYPARLSIHVPDPPLDLPLQVTISGLCRNVPWTCTTQIIWRPGALVTLTNSEGMTAAGGDISRLDLLIDGPSLGGAPLSADVITCQLRLESSRQVARRLSDISSYLDFELSRTVPVIIVPELSDQIAVPSR